MSWVSYLTLWVISSLGSIVRKKTTRLVGLFYSLEGEQSLPPANMPFF